MVMTILEARVDRRHWTALKTIYRTETQTLDPGIVQTFLIQGKPDNHLWRILTVWESQAALDAMHQSGEIPGGVRIFQTAQVQPTLGVFDLVGEAKI